MESRFNIYSNFVYVKVNVKVNLVVGHCAKANRKLLLASCLWWPKNCCGISIQEVYAKSSFHFYLSSGPVLTTLWATFEGYALCTVSNLSSVDSCGATFEWYALRTAKCCIRMSFGGRQCKTACVRYWPASALQHCGVLCFCPACHAPCSRGSCRCTVFFSLHSLFLMMCSIELVVLYCCSHSFRALW